MMLLFACRGYIINISGRCKIAAGDSEQKGHSPEESRTLERVLYYVQVQCRRKDPFLVECIIRPNVESRSAFSVKGLVKGISTVPGTVHCTYQVT